MIIKNRYTGNVIYEGASSDLSCIDLSYSNLSGVDLHGVDLSYSDLHKSDMRHSNLLDSNLSGSNLSEIDLRYSDMSRSDMSRSNLRRSDMSGSNLRYSNLRESNLSESDLRGSNLRGVNLRHTIGDSQIIYTIHTTSWIVVICTKIDVMAIGCEQHSIDGWATFKDSKINSMDPKALEFWGEWKELIFQYINLIKQGEK